MASHASQKQWVHRDRLSKHFSDLIRGWETLRLFKAESRAHIATLQSGEEYRVSTMKVLKIAFLSAFSLEFLATISTALLAVEIGFRVVYGKMDYLPAITILVLAPEYYMPLRNLGGAFHASVSGIEAMNAILDFLKISPPKPINTGASQSLLPQWETIRIDDVFASYPDSSRNVLRNVSLTISRNNKIALVGPSGSGKSTFCNLVMQNLFPCRGTIFLDSVPAHDVSNEEWGSLFSTIPQRPMIAADSLYNNVLLGRKNITQSEFWDACQRAHLTDVIAALPQQEKTFLGENGITLSTGQAHRVALARTFLSKAPIVILDEPTAHLDPDTEKVVHDSIVALSQNRTLLIISHRESTIALCDRFFHFHNNTITENSHWEAT